MARARELHAALILTCASVLACGKGGDNATGTGGAGAGSTSETTSSGSPTTSNSVTSTGTTMMMASSSTGMMAMGDPCRGTPVPADQVYVPSGMCARLVGNVGSLRQITFASNGDMFGTT